jgi:hypothetical protein
VYDLDTADECGWDHEATTMGGQFFARSAGDYFWVLGTPPGRLQPGYKCVQFDASIGLHELRRLSVSRLIAGIGRANSTVTEFVGSDGPGRLRLDESEVRHVSARPLRSSVTRTSRM